jgi:hypothetical protein
LCKSVRKCYGIAYPFEATKATIELSQSTRKLNSVFPESNDHEYPSVYAYDETQSRFNN